jgi:hypothetical protein
MIVDCGSEKMTGVMKSLETVLDRASHMQHAGQRAWALRHAMDSALADLRRMPPAEMR